MAATKTKKQELSTKNYILIMASAAVVVVIISGFLLNGLIKQIILNTKVVQKKVTANNKLTEKVEAAPILIDNYKDLGDKQKLIEHALPTSPDFPQVVSIVESMAASAGVRLKSVTPNGGAAIGGVTGVGDGTAQTQQPAPSSGNTSAQPVEYQFGISAIGGYPQLMELMKNIELSARPMKVIAIEFSGEAGSITAELSVVTYHQPKADVKDKEEVVK